MYILQLTPVNINQCKRRIEKYTQQAQLPAAVREVSPRSPEQRTQPSHDGKDRESGGTQA